MKLIFTTIIFTMFIGQTALAETIRWSTTNSPHPLWDALDLPEKKGSEGDIFKTTFKQIDGVSCSKNSLSSPNPIQPGQVQYHCNFDKNLTTKQAQKLFSVLSVDTIDTRGAYTEIKVLDKMIVIGSDDDEDGNEFARVYLCLLYTSPSPRDKRQSRMPSSA